MTEPLQAKTWSLGRTLSRNIILLVAVGWLLTIGLAVLMMQRELNEVMDEELRALADATALLLDGSPSAPLPRAISVSGEGDERVVRIIPLGYAAPPAPWVDRKKDGFSESNGWRVLRSTTENAVIEIGHSRSWRKEEVAEAAIGMAWLLVPLALGTLIAVQRSVAGAVKPVSDLARAVSSRSAEEAAPISEADLPNEMRPLVSSLNSYIGRVDRMRASEREFTANAAHELRTPIASLQATLEADHPDAATAVRGQFGRLTKRIERLLQLSRSESGVALGEGPSDLIEVMGLILADTRDSTLPRVILDDNDLEQLPLRADPDALAILLRNVIDNGRENATGPVRVCITPSARVVVENPVAEGAEFLEERFASRSGGRGSGLGLTIIATVAKALGVTVEKSIADGKASVTLDFGPLAQTGQDEKQV
ncbi:histidine kinase dimerization/phospho-acceptor domain-containing protein [Thioclava sp. FR2]|uniref:histidine kinase dimerization/phospho-acceptor domain-containing protein n=1 Tax=Thioclava sp. FR2 TaxID=3445780 RepID=UPI003EB93FE0